jgi:hypothetical protein
MEQEQSDWLRKLREEQEQKALKQPTSRERYEVCKSCDSFMNVVKVCKECGCFMPIKTLIDDTACPLGKW